MPTHQDADKERRIRLYELLAPDTPDNQRDKLMADIQAMPASEVSHNLTVMLSVEQTIDDLDNFTNRRRRR